MHQKTGFTVDRTLNDATYTNPSTATVVVRNSGFASFANQNYLQVKVILLEFK